MNNKPIYATDSDLPPHSVPCDDCGRMQGWWDCYVSQMTLDGEWVTLCPECHDRRFPTTGEVWQWGRCISDPEKSPVEQQLRLFE